MIKYKGYISWISIPFYVLKAVLIAALFVVGVIPMILLRLVGLFEEVGSRGKSHHIKDLSISFFKYFNEYPETDELE